jgi:sulfide dehydrogenase [flavocytochrome c] flavoprotein subunit
MTTRRRFLHGSLGLCAVFTVRFARAQASPRVVVIGGGFAGASCARALKRFDRRIAVTLVERDAMFTACPFSNEVVAGLRELRAQEFTLDKLAGDGIELARPGSIRRRARWRWPMGRGCPMTV